MKKVLIIMARECRMRLRHASFWVLALLVPVLLAALYALPVVAAHKAAKPTTVAVVDETGLFLNGLSDNEVLRFRRCTTIDEARQQADIVLVIPLRQTTIPRDAFLYYSGTAPSTTVQSMVDNQMQQLLRNAIMEDVYHLDPATFYSVERAYITLHTRDAASGHESHLEVKTVVALALAVLMVLAMVLYVVQVMRSVQEERHNRVAEVVTTSARPVQLLSGKVAGVALTALLQLGLWAMLTTAAIAGIQASSPTLFAQAKAQQEMPSIATRGEAATAQYSTPTAFVDQTVEGLTAIHLPLVAGVFALFFFLGYLFYGSLGAALAARLDTEAPPLPWALLLATPLLIALMLSPLTMQAPSGALAHWLTAIPFSAPVEVLLRLPFGLPTWQAAVAAALLVASAALAALLAARTYNRHLIR